MVNRTRARYPDVALAQNVLPEGAKWEKISSAGRAFGEGVVAAKDGSLYLVDLTAALPDNPGGTIYRHDPKTRPPRCWSLAAWQMACMSPATAIF